ncbi:MAG: YlxR family protein [Clostridia bacterium]
MKKVAKNKLMQTKYEPQRMCIVCRKIVDKKQLIRIVRTVSGNYEFDFTLKANGRGAYVCNDPICINRLLDKKLLNRAFKTKISDDIYNRLREEYEQYKN